MFSFILQAARNFDIFTRKRERYCVRRYPLFTTPSYMYVCSIHIEAWPKTNFEQFSILNDEHSCKYKFWATFVRNGYGRWTLRSYIYWDITLLPQISAFRYHKTTPYIVSWHTKEHVLTCMVLCREIDVWTCKHLFGMRVFRKELSYQIEWGVSLHK